MNVKITNVRTTPPVTISPPLKWTQLTHRCSMFANVWMDSKVIVFRNYHYLCISKYPGEFCEENIDDCENHGCEAGGRCVDGVGTFSCLCPRGYSGRLCEVDEDECRDNPCSHGATCRDGPGESVFYILHLGMIQKLRNPFLRHFSLGTPPFPLHNFLADQWVVLRRLCNS